MKCKRLARTTFSFLLRSLYFSSCYLSLAFVGGHMWSNQRLLMNDHRFFSLFVPRVVEDQIAWNYCVPFYFLQSGMGHAVMVLDPFSCQVKHLQYIKYN